MASKKNGNKKDAPKSEAPKEQDKKPVAEHKEEQAKAKGRQGTTFVKSYAISNVMVELSDVRDLGWFTIRVTLEDGRKFSDRLQKMYSDLILDSEGKPHWSRSHELAKKLVEKIGGKCVIIPLIGEDIKDEAKPAKPAKPAKKAAKKEEPAKAKSQEPKGETKEEPKGEPQAEVKVPEPITEDKLSELEKETAAKDEKKSKDEAKKEEKDKKAKEKADKKNKVDMNTSNKCYGCDEVTIPNPPGKCGLIKNCKKPERFSNKPRA